MSFILVGSRMLNMVFKMKSNLGLHLSTVAYYKLWQ